ncbi:MAG: type IX secretion system membrane protein PorP/SprF [Flavobacteriales bacterium]|nr:type IX secretion system membrane protein PorP/SprF [Flavobacteriales bacterium]
MRTVLSISVLVFSFGAFAQQRTQYSQYMNNGYLINPAVTGIENYADIKIGHVNQWVGFDGSPTSTYLSLHSPLGFIKDSVIEVEPTIPALPMRGRATNAIITKSTDEKVENLSNAPERKIRHGIGTYVYNETAGPLANRGMAVSYAFHYNLGDYNIPAGLALGVLNYEFNPDELKLVNNADATFGVTTMNDYMPNMNLGLMLYSDKLFFGISSRQLLGNKFSVTNEYTTLSSQLSRHYFVSGGYRFLLMDNQLQLVPSLMFRYVSPVPPSIDINVQATYKDLLMFGVSYRHKDAIVAMFGVNFYKRFSLSYSYDFTTSALAKYSSGTHGIVLGVKINDGSSLPKRTYFW